MNNESVEQKVNFLVLIVYWPQCPVKGLQEKRTPKIRVGKGLKAAHPAATFIDLQISRRRLISSWLMKPPFHQHD